MKIPSPVAAGLFAALCLVSSPAAAQPLPQVALTSPAGVTVDGTVLQAAGQWLLAYVVPGSAPSDRLVQALGEKWTPERGARIILIVSGPVDAARAYLTAKGGEALGSGATWYSDTDGTAWSALKFQGTLAIAGVVGTTIEWKLDGVINDPDVLQQPIATWLDRH
jgi:hypothetical protein